MNQSKINMTNGQATKLLKQGEPLSDLEVEGKIDLTSNDYFGESVVIKDCIVESFDGSVTQFTKPVHFTNTRFKDCRFIFTYFLEGLTIDNCVFEQYLDFQAGGHNKSGFPITIKESIFSEFVNFCDCWYNGEVNISGNTFIKGTNIESQEQYLTFDIKPTILNNFGLTNIESEFNE